MLKIDVANYSTALLPGDRMVATIEWDFPSSPSSISISLEWFTEGKGDGDTQSIATESWQPMDSRGSKTWESILPRGPLSLSGPLISIRWQLRVTCKKPKEEATFPFVLSHGESPIRIRKAIPADPA